MINFQGKQIVYVCSPYRGEVKKNKKYARELTKKVLEAGYTPITPHLYLTEVLNDNITAERAIGLTAGLALLQASNYIYIGDKYGISEGMAREIANAKAKGIQVLDLEKVQDESEERN